MKNNELKYQIENIIPLEELENNSKKLSGDILERYNELKKSENIFLEKKKYFTKDWLNLKEIKKELFNLLPDNLRSHNFMVTDSGWDDGCYIYIDLKSGYPKNGISVMVSGMSEYYIISVFDYSNKCYIKDSEFDNLLVKEDYKLIDIYEIYLKNKGCKRMSSDIYSIPIDLVGYNKMPYETYQKEKGKLFYESHIEYLKKDCNMNYFLEMMLDKVPKNKEEDFEVYCRYNYEGPFTVKDMLFGEPD